MVDSTGVVLSTSNVDMVGAAVVLGGSEVEEGGTCVELCMSASNKRRHH